MSSSQNLVAGVIGVQGDVSEHIGAISRLGAHRNISIDTLVIRQPGLIPKCDFLAIPGGESTTISRLIDDIDLSSEIISYAASGKPLLVTCAGLIVASSNANDPRVKTLNLFDVSILENYRVFRLFVIFSPFQFFFINIKTHRKSKNGFK